ncbi:MAG: S1/P1 nuclease [Chitinophagaceae bacterium]|nr:S1/P1 nuclease [Chitinophagaceae bacterium]
MNLIKKTILVISFIALSIPSMAWWGINGHRIVGEIADGYLNSKARKALKELLGDESIAMASNWGDFIKSDSLYDYVYSWHYINLKGGMSFSELQSKLQTDTVANLYNKVNFLISELKSNKSLTTQQRTMYLKLLIHFVGDLHQPLHVGGRPEDQGGNRVKVLWFNEPTNIHSVWDDKLVEFQKLSYTEYAKAINHANKQMRKSWQQQPRMEWYWESYQISQTIYASIKQPDQKLSYGYNYDYIATVNQQLLKGGVRLAGVLNDIFG